MIVVDVLFVYRQKPQNMNVESLVGLHNQFMFMQAESQKGLTHPPISDMKLPLLQKYHPFQATYMERVTALRTEPRVTPAMANHDKNMPPICTRWIGAATATQNTTKNHDLDTSCAFDMARIDMY